MADRDTILYVIHEMTLYVLWRTSVINNQASCFSLYLFNANLRHLTVIALQDQVRLALLHIRMEQYARDSNRQRTRIANGIAEICAN